MLVRPVMLPSSVWSRTQNSFAAKVWRVIAYLAAQNSFAAKVWRVIAYLAATFAPATMSDKGTRKKFETQDHSRGTRNCGVLAQRPLF